MVAADIKDPRLGFVTVTRVELTSDLRHARVYVGVLGDQGDGGESLEVLKGASGFVRREIGRRLRIRFSPVIDFRYDKGLEATDRVARLLEAEASSGGGAPGGEPEPGAPEGPADRDDLE